MSYDDDNIPAGFKLAAAGILLVASGLWHHFACSTQDITGAKVLDKSISKVWVKTGKYGGHYNTYYHIKTDKGVLDDNSDIWENKWSSGQIYDKVQLDSVYNFNVDKDAVLGDENILKYSSPKNNQW